MKKEIPKSILVRADEIHRHDACKSHRSRFHPSW